MPRLLLLLPLLLLAGCASTAPGWEERLSDATTLQASNDHCFAPDAQPQRCADGWSGQVRLPVPAGWQALRSEGREQPRSMVLAQAPTLGRDCAAVVTLGATGLASQRPQVSRLRGLIQRTLPSGVQVASGPQLGGAVAFLTGQRSRSGFPRGYLTLAPIDRGSVPEAEQRQHCRARPAAVLQLLERVTTGVQLEAVSGGRRA